MEKVTVTFAFFPIRAYNVIMQFRQALVQEQRQKMNPQLLASIKLMELPIMDLRERIELELEANPALEIIEDNSSVPLEENNPQNKPEDEHFNVPLDKPEAPSLSEEEEYEYFETSSVPRAAQEYRSFIEGALTRPETLQEFLLRQLQLEPIDSEQRSIAEILIQNLNDDGFHKEKPETLFAEPQPRLQEVMELVWGLEPLGCCTENYRESLKVQINLTLKNNEPLNSVNEPWLDLILENLDLVEREKYAALSKITGLDDEDTWFICDLIKKLSPFPGRAFVSKTAETRFVIPDIRVIRDKDEFFINLNDEAFPVLGTNSFFEKMSNSGDESTKEFAREKIREARLFINHLNQRNRTLIRVSNAIMEFQRAFFINGPKFLAPLTLGDIAKELKIHETTVSRTANGKYMQTDWGIFELKYFFTNSISGAGSGGSQFSKESVKQIIIEILAAENRLLSDQDISDHLSKKGIALARRTVAKYRKELDMGSSYTRKVQNKNSGGAK